ncbi:DUF3630 family protein [Pseudomonas asplenii]|uniref:DUF3630 family protein n=1 Tax=Pseudomonas asplenii TaxID=53407 RepID=UPI0037C96592
MATIEVSVKADWELFEDMARVLEQGLGGRWKEKLDGLDQRYWGLLVDEHTVTLHLEHYLCICIIVPDSADDTAQRVCALLNRPPCG